jgi:ketosteroid isomerase-like protein
VSDPVSDPAQAPFAADREALRELVEAYALAADSGNPEAVASLFTERGRLVVHHDPERAAPTGVRTGRAEIAAAMATLARYRATTHMVGAHRAEVEGDRARGETTGTAHHVVVGDDGAGSIVVFGLRYVDDFVRGEDGSWRFAERRVLMRWRDERRLGTGGRP